MAMEEEGHATVAVRNPSFDRPLRIKRSNVSMDGVDSISDLSDEILHHIFSFIPTKFAIRTSVLSKRWRHVWSETPHLSFEWLSASLNSINKTLASSYSASKITSFHLCTDLTSEAHFVNSSIEFAMTHNVDNLNLAFRNPTTKFKFPDFFYTNSSVKQLTVDLGSNMMIPRCTVSWTSLKNLSLTCCNLSDESFLKILSGCPILESLRLQFCKSLHSLDLSQSLRLRRLEIERCSFFPAPMQIVAPHIHYLRLRDSEALCSLVDVSSLTEANVDVGYFQFSYQTAELLKPDVCLAMVQTMLGKFHNVEKLTLGVNFLQILSLYKIPGLPLPRLKVKTLTLETMILRSVVPGIARLLQNSHELNKLSVYTIKKCSTVLDQFVNSYLDLQDLNLDKCWRLKEVVFPTSWKCEVVEPKLVASFMELLLANTRTLETLVLLLGSYTNRSRFEELFQIALTLSHYYKVSIVLK